jgi:hypothetical protein
MLGFDFRHVFKHKLIDALKNLKLSWDAERRVHTYEGGTRMAYPPSGYNKVFEDRFDAPLNKKEWRFGMPWGDFHNGYLHQYYDTTGNMAYVSPEGLVLELRKIPKTWKKSDLPEWKQKDLPEEFTIPVGVGFVSTKQTWQYGWFEAWIKLPKGQSFWPAFWSSAIDSWPPEIDILEAYSERGPKYNGPTISQYWRYRPNRQIRPNLHYGKTEDGTKDDYIGYDIPVAECTERFVQYACLWEEDRIEIYYDGYKVQECTDPKILKWYNEGGKHYFILCHGLHNDYPENPDESAMLIRSFKVFQK